MSGDGTPGAWLRTGVAYAVIGLLAGPPNEAAVQAARAHIARDPDPAALAFILARIAGQLARDVQGDELGSTARSSRVLAECLRQAEVCADLAQDEV